MATESEGARRGSVSPDWLFDRLRRGDPVSVLDVRDRDEADRWGIEGPSVATTHVPYARFLQAAATGTVDDLIDDHDLTGPTVVACARGEASAEVASLLGEAGVAADNLAGGMTAWARAYRRVPLGAAGGAHVYQYDRPSSGCLSYLVVDGEAAAVVDPLRAFADRYAADADELGADLRWAVDTHVHADHVSGVRSVADATGADPVLPAGATDRGLAFDATLVGDGDSIPVGQSALTVRKAPGHTTEAVALRVGDVLLTADTLLIDGVGRPDLEPGGDGAGETTVESLARALYETLHERLDLSGETLVAPGHYGDPTVHRADGSVAASAAEVRDRLSLLGLDRAAFVDHVAADTSPRPANYQRIVAVNLGREAADAGTAFELELGPNNCAVSD